MAAHRTGYKDTTRDIEDVRHSIRLSADSPENGYFTAQVAVVHVDLAGRALPDPVRFIPRRVIG